MKKIKSIKQVQIEKKRIMQRQEELEHKVQDTWQEVKECLRPANIAKDTIAGIFKYKMEKPLEEEHILKSSFTYGVSLLAGKFAGKAADKLESVFKK